MKKYLFPLFLLLIFASRILTSSIYLYEGQAYGSKYVINAVLNPDDARVEGNEIVTFINESSEEVRSVFFGLLNQKNEQNLINRCSIGGESIKYEKKQLFSTEGFDVFEVFLPEALQAGQEVNIEIAFRSGKVSYNYGFYHYNYAWHPIALTLEKGIPDYRIKNNIAFDVSLKYPKDYKVALSGLVDSKIEKDGIVTVSSKANNIYKFVVLASRDFLIDEAECKGVKIYSYYYKDDEKWGKKLLDLGKDIISFYIEKIGFYPQPVLSILPGASSPMGGYPVGPNVVVVHRGLDMRGEDALDFTSRITAHEIGHQYWGFNYTLERGGYPLWFGLSMGIYTDRLYSEARGLNADIYQNYIHRYIGGVIAGVNTTIMQEGDLLDKQDFDWNNIIAHCKSYTVLTILENYAGKDVFSKIFKAFLEKFKGKMVTLEMFKSVCEEISGKDLTGFFDTWYKSTVFLDYRIMNVRTGKEEDEFITDCTIERKGEAIMPLDVVLKMVDGAFEAKTIDGKDKSTIVKFKTKAAPLLVLLDPEDKLPLLEKYEKNPDAVMYAVDTLEDMKKYNDAHQLLLCIESFVTKKNLQEYFLYLGRQYRYVGDFKAAVDYFKKGLDIKILVDKQVEGLLILNLGITYDQMNDRKSAETYYKKSLEYANVADWAKQYLEKPYTNR